MTDQTPAPLRTADEWCDVLGVDVLDADGWDRSSEAAFAASWNERITEAEFQERVGVSTIAHLTPPMTPSAPSDARTPAPGPDGTTQGLSGAQTGHGFTCDPACRCDANIASGRGGDRKPIPPTHVLVQQIERL
jgi:hypothetical protein